MSEIDPMVFESPDGWVPDTDDVLALSGMYPYGLIMMLHYIHQYPEVAGLAAAQPSREDIRYAIAGALHPDNLPPQFVQRITNAVMAVLEPEQGGDDSAPHVSGEHIADLDLEFEDGGEGKQLLAAQGGE